MSDRTDKLREAARLAEASDYEEGHSRHVTALALELFDELRGAHGLDDEHRTLLHCAALLHDIGWTEGKRGHHKAAQRMILASLAGPFSERERAIVACVARYHRKATPKPSHEPYHCLSKADRGAVAVLGGVLKLADALDRRHVDAVEGVKAVVTAERIEVLCAASDSCFQEQAAADTKKDLLEQALGRSVSVRFVPGRATTESGTIQGHGHGE